MFAQDYRAPELSEFVTKTLIRVLAIGYGVVALVMWANSLESGVITVGVWTVAIPFFVAAASPYSAGARIGQALFAIVAFMTLYSPPVGQVLNWDMLGQLSPLLIPASVMAFPQLTQVFVRMLLQKFRSA